MLWVVTLAALYNEAVRNSYMSLGSDINRARWRARVEVLRPFVEAEMKMKNPLQAYWAGEYAIVLPIPIEKEETS
jgi:hypothetical protein